MNGMMNERLDYDFPRDTGPLTGPAAFPQVPPQVAPQVAMGVDPMIGQLMQSAPMPLPMVPNEGIGLGSPTQPWLSDVVSNPTDAILQAELTNRLSNLSPTASMIGEAPTFTTSAMNVNQTALPPMPPMQPAGEMLGERQLTPMDQTALPMQAQADLTRTATMGTPVPVNPWGEPKRYGSKWVDWILPRTPGTQGFLDLQDPYFQHRWDTGYKPFLNNLAGAMFPPYGAYNLYNQFIR